MQSVSAQTASELQRLSVIERLHILDTPNEQIYQDAVELAAHICNTPFASVGLIDRDRQWFKACIGADVTQVPKDSSISGYTILEATPFIVHDLSADPRFFECPNVIGPPLVRFYAGVPIFADGVAVGALCVLDTFARQLEQGQIAALEAIGRQVSSQLELRLNAQLLLVSKKELSAALARSEALSCLVHASAQRYENLFRNLPIGCCAMDLDGKILAWNHSNEVIFGHREVDVIGLRLWELCSPEERLAAEQRFSEVLASGGYRSARERAVTRTDGTVVTILASMIPMIGADGELEGVVRACIDISDRKQFETELRQTNVHIENQNSALEAANHKLESLALTDELTGLYNRRAFNAFSEMTFSRAQRTGNGLALILLDVDKFKDYNDQFGHADGDVVLMTVARIINSSVRQGDVVCRYGGEEFVVLLPETSSQDASLVAEELRRKLQDYPWPLRPITASFGVAISTFVTSTIEDVFRRADERLYLAKARGRNQVVGVNVASDGVSESLAA